MHFYFFKTVGQVTKVTTENRGELAEKNDGTPGRTARLRSHAGFCFRTRLFWFLLKYSLPILHRMFFSCVLKTLRQYFCLTPFLLREEKFHWENGLPRYMAGEEKLLLQMSEYQLLEISDLFKNLVELEKIFYNLFKMVTSRLNVFNSCQIYSKIYYLIWVFTKFVAFSMEKIWNCFDGQPGQLVSLLEISIKANFNIWAAIDWVHL